MRLPTEVIDMMFGLMADDPYGPDIETMKACNLVSSSFSAICERHLYSCVYFCIHSITPQGSYRLERQPDQYFSRCQMTVPSFNRIQTNKPRVNHCVRRLGLIVLDQVQWRKKSHWWKTVESILLQLQHDKIEWLKLVTNSIGRAQIDPNIISGPVTDILKSPALRTLHLNTGLVTSLPLYHLHARPSNLRVLDIGTVKVDTSAITNTSSFTDPVHLDSLSLRWGSQQHIVTVDSIRQSGARPLIDISALSSFLIVMSHIYREQDVALAQAVLEGIDNLKTLTLQSTDHIMDVVPESTTVASAIEKHSSTLQTLVLSWRCSDLSVGILSNMPQFLGFDSSFTSLRTVRLRMVIPFTEKEILRDQYGWMRIGDALLRFPALRVVEVLIVLGTPIITEVKLFAERYLEEGKVAIIERLKSNTHAIHFSFGVIES